MSTSYVMPGISWEAALDCASQICSVRKMSKEDDRIVYYRLQMEMHDPYAEAKRQALSDIIGINADNIPKADDYSTIYLYETEDQNNAWFEGTAVSRTHPELILEAISDACDTFWLSEHDDDYEFYIS